MIIEFQNYLHDGTLLLAWLYTICLSPMKNKESTILVSVPMSYSLKLNHWFQSQAGLRSTGVCWSVTSAAVSTEVWAAISRRSSRSRRDNGAPHSLRYGSSFNYCNYVNLGNTKYWLLMANFNILIITALFSWFLFWLKQNLHWSGVFFFKNCHAIKK